MLELRNHILNVSISTSYVRSVWLEQRQKDGNKATCRSYPSVYIVLYILLQTWKLCGCTKNKLSFKVHLCKFFKYMNSRFKPVGRLWARTAQSLYLIVISRCQDFSTKKTVNQNKLSLSENKVYGVAIKRFKRYARVWRRSVHWWWVFGERVH